jgi:hypothetical protein
MQQAPPESRTTGLCDAANQVCQPAEAVSAQAAAGRFRFLKASLLALVGLHWFAGCQAAFGDFKIDTGKLACQAFETRCAGSRVEACVNGSDWQLLENCSSPDLCDLTTLSCKPCRPGAGQCNGAQPQSCGADGRWHAMVAPCATAALCRVDDSGNAACVASKCPEAGRVQCADNRLQRCPSTLTDWQDLETCASPLVCDSAHAAAQVAAGGFPTCVAVPADPQTCTPGAFRCDLAAFERCSSDGSRWVSLAPCRNSVLCNLQATRCESPACSSGGVTRCQNDQQQRCRDNLTGWDEVAACSGASPFCDPDRGCLSTPCTEGAYRCNDVALERCVNRVWIRQELCATRTLCHVVGQCAQPACATDAKKCSADLKTLMQCNSDRTDFDATTCPSNQPCNPTTLSCG